MDTSTAEKKTIAIPRAIVVRDLAKLFAIPVNRVLVELMKNGVMTSMNERIDFETAAIVADNFGFSATLKESDEGERQQTLNEQLGELLAADNEEGKETRPPVVVVMGHVDHGKTKLLDAIRKTDIVAGEAGGITQHIGAYQVERNGKPITFIDTPGHEAFTAMRSRGAHVADIAILVVAADDGVKPQTLEALKIIQYAKLPFLVAVNKIDKPEANLDRVKQQLAEQNVLPEEWGGKAVLAPVSATSGAGIEDLLETVLLLAGLEDAKLRADPHRPAVGSVIEAHIDKGEGPVATVIIRTGTLRAGDWIRVGDVIGRVKLMKDWRGDVVDAARPSQPVKILGLKTAPEVGDIVAVVTQEEAKKVRRLAKPVTERRRTETVFRRKEDTEQSRKPQEKKASLTIVLRCDNLGSQEAILESLQRYEDSPVGIEIVSKGLGNITESDVDRTASANALLIGFHTTPTQGALEVAKGKRIRIHTYRVIYDLLRAIRAEVETRLPTERVETVLGHVKVLAVFRRGKKDMIVGGRVTDGRMETGSPIRVSRGKQIIAEGTAREVQTAKQKAESVAEGKECGVRFVGAPLIEEGDVLESYRTEEKKVTLSV